MWKCGLTLSHIIFPSGTHRRGGAKTKLREWIWGGCLAALLIAWHMPSAAWGASFQPGQFLGLFTATQARFSLAQQVQEVDHLLGSNPYLKGLTIRVLWKEEEPQQDHFDWSALDRMISVAHARHVYFTLDPVAGVMTPDWVYTAGAKKFSSIDINRFHPTYGQTRSVPVPWDSVYRKLWRNFLTRLAARYGNDPSLLEVTINGHNTTVEMIMPHTPDDMERWRQLGWSPELVESDWKGWIDFFAQTFPATHIGLMLSPMYGQSTKSIVEDLAAYAVSRYAKRLILMTAVLYGRRDQLYMFQTHIVLEYPQVLNAHEAISTFRDPQRQGSMQMFIYNIRQFSPLFVRLWRNDAGNVEECEQIVTEYQHARSMSLADYRSTLERQGLYTTVDTYQGNLGRAQNQMRGFRRFGGRRPWMSGYGSGAPSQGTYPGQGGAYPGQGNSPEQNTFPGAGTSSPADIQPE
jgi:Beta-galactosidase